MLLGVLNEEPARLRGAPRTPAATGMFRKDFRLFKPSNDDTSNNTMIMIMIIMIIITIRRRIFRKGDDTVFSTYQCNIAGLLAKHQAFQRLP